MLSSTPLLSRNMIFRCYESSRRPCQLAIGSRPHLELGDRRLRTGYGGPRGARTHGKATAVRHGLDLLQRDLRLKLKVFGDLSGHSELVVRGSLSDRNLLGFYLQQGRLVATLAVGQEKQTEEELQLLIKQQVVLDSDLLADPSTDISSLLKPAANDR
jgi:NAD/ferredoxin-dependent reductase-like protein